MDDPIFRTTIFDIDFIFDLEVFFVVARRKDLYDQVWCTDTTCIVQFGLVANHTNVRLYKGKNLFVFFRILCKTDIKGGGINFTRLSLQKSVNDITQFNHNLLMDAVGSSGPSEDFPLDDFYHFFDFPI